MEKTQTFFIETGNIFSLTDNRRTVVHDSLPVGIYQAGLDPMKGFFLRRTNAVKENPTKIYGTLDRRVKRVMMTWEQRAQQGFSTGVLLSGIKGAGKTLMLRELMRRCGLPVILVSDALYGAAFFDMLTTGGPKLIALDEFEKVYKDENAQNAILSLLDGHYKNTNLTVATVNDTHKLVDAMKNRPSRFYYHYRHASLDREFVREFCVDQLKGFDTDKVVQIQNVVDQVQDFNFDMLQVLVEEMNRFGDAPEECLRHLNIVPPHSGWLYKVTAWLNDDPEHKHLELLSDRYNSHTLMHYGMHLNIMPKDKDFRKKIQEEFDPEGDIDLFYINGETDFVSSSNEGILTMRNECFTCVLTPQYSAKQWAL